MLNNDNKVFVGKRKDNPVNKWQMPQGGVNKNENFVLAMKRELYEETSIKNIEILKELNGWLEYELPKELLGIIWKGKYRGQKQKNGLLQDLQATKVKSILKTKNPEFIEWKWIETDDLPNVIVDFKKESLFRTGKRNKETYLLISCKTSIL